MNSRWYHVLSRWYRVGLITGKAPIQWGVGELDIWLFSWERLLVCGWLISQYITNYQTAKLLPVSESPLTLVTSWLFVKVLERKFGSLAVPEKSLPSLSLADESYSILGILLFVQQRTMFKTKLCLCILLLLLLWLVLKNKVLYPPALALMLSTYSRTDPTIINTMKAWLKITNFSILNT